MKKYVKGCVSFLEVYPLADAISKMCYLADNADGETEHALQTAGMVLCLAEKGGLYLTERLHTTIAAVIHAFGYKHREVTTMTNIEGMDHLRIFLLRTGDCMFLIENRFYERIGGYLDRLLQYTAWKEGVEIMLEVLGLMVSKSEFVKYFVESQVLNLFLECLHVYGDEEIQTLMLDVIQKACKLATTEEERDLIEKSEVAHFLLCGGTFNF